VDQKPLQEFLGEIQQFLEDKFPPSNFKTYSQLSPNGVYSMTYQNVVYSIEFTREQELLITTQLPTSSDNLESILSKNLLPNHELKRTNYFAEQKITTNADKTTVQIYIVLSNFPRKEKRKHAASQLWESVIQKVMRSISKLPKS